MKTRILISTTVILFILSSCVKEHFTELHNKDSKYITITGNSMYGFSNQNSRAATISQIPADGNIMFYSEGGIKADGDILSMENGRWTGLKNDQWDTSGADADIAAYYPVIKNYEDLYSDNGELQDMVWCKTTAKVGESINLSFSHMFAKLVIKIESELNDTVKNVKVNIPSKINGIDFYTGELTFEENGNADVTLARNDEGKYELFIPESNTTNISIEILCNNGKKYNSSINNREYEAGYEYICNVKYNAGIFTTEDFIAFTHLINGETEYNGKTLEDFYVMQDGKRVFNLYNDLSFTEEESSNIVLIGDRSKAFDDIFNGNNHKLDGIYLYEKPYCSPMGLFVLTGENSIIKNLILSNCRCNTDYKKDISLIAGRNNGFIDNCHVINFSVNNISDKQYSSLINLNYGTIINSSISGFKLKNNTSIIGTLCFTNNGNIINCRIKNNFTKKPTGTASSIICAFNHKNIFNVFIEDYQSNLYGLCSTNYINGQYNNCIMPQLYESKIVGTDNAHSSPLEGVYLYEDTAEEYQTAANSLNEWIDSKGKELYPTLTFRRWTTDQTQKVIFE